MDTAESGWELGAILDAYEVTTGDVVVPDSIERKDGP